MFHFKKGKQDNKERKKAEAAKRSTDFAIFNAVSGGQRSSYGDRSEICAGAMNNNQRLATLQMMRNMRDTE